MRKYLVYLKVIVSTNYRVFNKNWEKVVTSSDKGTSLKSQKAIVKNIWNCNLQLVCEMCRLKYTQVLKYHHLVCIGRKKQIFFNCNLRHKFPKPIFMKSIFFAKCGHNNFLTELTTSFAWLPSCSCFKGHSTFQQLCKMTF